MLQNGGWQSGADEKRINSQLSTLSTLTKDYERLYTRLRFITERASEESPKGLIGWFLKSTGQYTRAAEVSENLEQILEIRREGDKLVNDILSAARIASRAIRSTNEQAIGRIVRLNHEREVKIYDFVDTVKRYRNTIEVVIRCAHIDSNMQEFITWVDNVNIKEIDRQEVAQRSAELSNIDFNGSFSGADLEYLELNERLGHEQKWRTIIQKAAAEESTHLQAVSAEKLRVLTTQYEIICKHTAGKFEVEIERFYDEIDMLKAAVALNHLSELENHLNRQSQKIEFIREQLIVDPISKNPHEQELFEN